MFHHSNLSFREKLRTRNENATEFIVIHHTRVSGHSSVQEVHQWHLNRRSAGKPWAGIGYHYYIDREGEVFDGRPVDSVGAHAADETHNYNPVSVGVCFDGDFNKQKITDRQLNASVMLISLLSLAYGDIPLRKHESLIPGRCCPGSLFPFDRLVREVEACKRQLKTLFGDRRHVYRTLIDLL